jgi:hypothetical protein
MVKTPYDPAADLAIAEAAQDPYYISPYEAPPAAAGELVPGAAAAGSAAYHHWVSVGRPCKLATPIAQFAAYLHHHGYTVGTVGDTRHMLAIPPEDHVPLGATGWPSRNAFGYVYALDIMPPSPQTKLPSLAKLAGRIITDRNTNVPGSGWIKYINWTTTGGACQHVSWQPRHLVRHSGDVGHVHISARSDATYSLAAAHYDPIARAR